jgi:hypothetical protein
MAYLKVACNPGSFVDEYNLFFTSVNVVSYTF